MNVVVVVVVAVWCGVVDEGTEAGGEAGMDRLCVLVCLLRRSLLLLQCLQRKTLLLSLALTRFTVVVVQYDEMPDS